MKLRLKPVVAAAAAVALAGTGLAVTATSASAYGSPNLVSPPWVGTANDVSAVKGGLNFVDASGNDVFSGSNYNALPAFLVASGAKTALATKANLFMAFPQSSNPNVGLWLQQSLQGSTTFAPAPAGTPATINQANPFLKVNFGASPTPVDDAFGNNLVPDTTNGYANTFELRLLDSGTGAVPDGKYWRAVIEFNNTAAPLADGLAVGAWQQVFPTTAAPHVVPTSVTTPVATPISPIESGTSITLTSAASETATPANHPAGTIQFRDGTTNIGTAIAVDAAGSATTPSFVPALGSHSFNAVFTPTLATFNSATSGNLAFTVVVPAPHATATVLGAFTGLDGTGSVAQGGVIGGSAVVTDAKPGAGGAVVTVGQVVFKDEAGNVLATDTTPADGFTFSISSNALTVATHTVTAFYTDGTTFLASNSGAGTVIVTAPAFTPDPQNIQTSIAPGTIVISTPYTAAAPLVLPAMTLNSAATLYTTTAAFNNIQVTDTRPGNLPYTLSALSTNLTKAGVVTPNANQIINAQNVGLTALGLAGTNASPSTFLGGVAAGGSTAGQNLTAFDNPAANGLASGAAGSAGLGGAAAHAVLHANSGLGLTKVNGLLTITAPTNTLDGTYNGIVTFTVLGS
jgi:hypothetical protein